MSPAPNSMNTAIPLAFADSSTEPARESTESTATAAASISAGATVRSGHQSLNALVITVAARKTTITYTPQTLAAAANRPASTVRRCTGRTNTGWSRPRSASPRTAPSVRKTARIVPRKNVANIARPRIVAPATVRASTPSIGSSNSPTDSNSCHVPRP